MWFQLGMRIPIVQLWAIDTTNSMAVCHACVRSRSSCRNGVSRRNGGILPPQSKPKTSVAGYPRYISWLYFSKNRLRLRQGEFPLHPLPVIVFHYGIYGRCPATPYEPSLQTITDPPSATADYLAHWTKLRETRKPRSRFRLTGESQ